MRLVLRLCFPDWETMRHLGLLSLSMALVLGLLIEGVSLSLIDEAWPDMVMRHG